MNRSVSRTAVALLFLGLFLSYLSLFPASLSARGYSGEEIDSGLRMLEVFNAWVKGRPIPAMVWSRHGPTPVFFDLPFIKLGKIFGSPDLLVSFQPPLLTAGLLIILFLWLRKISTPAVALLITLSGAFGTMLWPYAYIGLETKQSFFVLLAGYLGLANGKIRGWPRLLFFAAACGLAMSVKSVGVILAPAFAYLLYEQFWDDWRTRPAQAVTVCLVIAGIVLASIIGRNFYWDPRGGGTTALSGWFISSSFQFVENAIGLFASPMKGLFLFAPVLLLIPWAIPGAFRTNRSIAIFAGLVTACTVAFISTLIAPTDEVWGPRFMHVTLAPLLLCIGAAWPGFQWRRHLPVVALGLGGVVVSFLGAFFYYGERGYASDMAGQNTMEWLNGDRVWNEIEFDAKLFRVWLNGGTDEVPWLASHIWVWTAPAGAPKWKTVNLRDYAVPQAFLVQNWNSLPDGGKLAVFRICLFSLIAGPLLLGYAIVRIAREGASAADAQTVGRRTGRIVVIAGLTIVLVVTLAVTWMKFPDLVHPPKLQLSSTEVVAGNGSYTLTIKEMPNAVVTVRFSIDNGEPDEFTAMLDAGGNVRFDVAADTPKGTYRVLAFSKADSLIWTHSDAAITIK